MADVKVLTIRPDLKPRWDNIKILKSKEISETPRFS